MTDSASHKSPRQHHHTAATIMSACADCSKCAAYAPDRFRAHNTICINCFHDRSVHSFSAPTPATELLEKYQRALLDAWVTAPPPGERIYPCGTANCRGLAILFLGEFEAVCSVCANHWCISCLVKWHTNLSCEQYQQWRKENDAGDARMDELIKQVGIARCPNGGCGTGVQKSHGCNHMTCRCGTHFCYLCGMQLMGPDYYSHFNKAGATCVLFTGKEYE